MNVNVSITDFPLQTSLERFFWEFKKARADGVEIVIGAKSIWNFKKIKRFSEKYNLPVVSLHQSPWSGIGFFFEREFARAIETLNVKDIVFHPFILTSFDSITMKRYFEKLQKIKEKYAVNICLENVENIRPYKQIYKNIYTVEEHLEEIYNIAKTYNFHITFDTTHARFVKPQNEKIFQTIFPKIGNIHLSSFTPGKEHLSLLQGNFDTKGFVKYLIKNKYKGLLTLEINYYLFERFLRPYDFTAIEKSIDLVKSVTDR